MKNTKKKAIKAIDTLLEQIIPTTPPSAATALANAVETLGRFVSNVTYSEIAEESRKKLRRENKSKSKSKSKSKKK